uniref:BZIP domain-containing protein n=1 Tax=Timspurckia oligopyrenoides TaxID=708627 RepID=A0A7S1ETZ4_9RHOD|mmetsp:Transcript_7803/g.14172  ORF Transcript_7803/g.14172 Transcript_7803/m.14172 type:complete len:259 (+) Transcript_7803:425-1201(+)|eukprot:CAMPEP_0182446086 /NCGR_PEP_ID=MMETSP1172-20130603/3980_1 /TAXON_ID=708627 /ORGANISM="Timspurckia oligopyrenoides, Strain CCMP3278" /LENGTH=258 /DNA_ID=CAMNT_0024641965 /DNA_START=381 /DNA_END=1157 /DNA_ORIENTATION=+
MNVKQELEELLSGHQISTESFEGEDLDFDVQKYQGFQDKCDAVAFGRAVSLLDEAGDTDLHPIDSADLDVTQVTPELAAARRKKLMELRAKKNLGMLRRQSSPADSAASGMMNPRYSVSERVDGGRKAVTDRVLRTRELALRARQRHKEKMSSLEEGNAELKKRQQELEKENEQLRQQIKLVSESLYGSDREQFAQHSFPTLSDLGMNIGTSDSHGLGSSNLTPKAIRSRAGNTCPSPSLNARSPRTQVLSPKLIRRT